MANMLNIEVTSLAENKERKKESINKSRRKYYHGHEDYRKRISEKHKDYNKEFVRNHVLITTDNRGNRIRITGLNKRPYPEDNRCELCDKPFKKVVYHHWIKENPNIGIWICFGCHNFAERADEGFSEIYIQKKQKIETECQKLPIAFYPKPNRNTECCHCGRKYSELKKLGVGLEEMKDVVGGDDWNWWCDDCYVYMVGQECEICHDVFTHGGIRCHKCNTILCSTCAKGHNCGIINRIKKIFRECLESNAKLYEYSPWIWKNNEM